MAQDFSASTLTREGSTWLEGSYVDGHYVKADAKVNAYGNIDSKYYELTTAEKITGAVTAAGVVVLSAVAAVCTCGASLAVEITAGKRTYARMVSARYGGCCTCSISI